MYAPAMYAPATPQLLNPLEGLPLPRCPSWGPAEARPPPPPPSLPSRTRYRTAPARRRSGPRSPGTQHSPAKRTSIHKSRAIDNQNVPIYDQQCAGRCMTRMWRCVTRMCRSVATLLLLWRRMPKMWRDMTKKKKLWRWMTRMWRKMTKPAATGDQNVAKYDNTAVALFKTKKKVSTYIRPYRWKAGPHGNDNTVKGRGGQGYEAGRLS